jgi:hypothetical protein
LGPNPIEEEDVEREATEKTERREAIVLDSLLSVTSCSSLQGREMLRAAQLWLKRATAQLWLRGGGWAQLMME